MQSKGIHLLVGQFITRKGQPLPNTDNAFQVYTYFAYTGFFSWQFSLFFVEQNLIHVKQIWFSSLLLSFYRPSEDEAINSSGHIRKIKRRVCSISYVKITKLTNHLWRRQDKVKRYFQI